VTGVSISAYKDTARELLLDGEEYWSDHYALHDIFKAIERGMMQFWIYQDADGQAITGLLTRIAVYPKHNALHVIWMGGKRFPPKEYFQAITNTFEYFARKYGCASMECKARVGLERAFEGLGFEKTAIYLERDVKLETRH